MSRSRGDQLSLRHVAADSRCESFTEDDLQARLLEMARVAIGDTEWNRGDVRHGLKDRYEQRPSTTSVWHGHLPISLWRTSRSNARWD
jgi:hypothetical protein